ncbi:hypothetical protein [Paenibacillus sp. HJGM_3]|uniref:hypothetical protein n=1 Tax=Paenibacillus sp. HJGM_3 TaxID=3379816 RepID=UPI00385F0DC2
MYPFNYKKGHKIQTDAPGFAAKQSFLARIALSSVQAVAAAVAGILPAVTDSGAQQVITTGFTNPAYPRNVTATAGGTATDIKAIQVIVEGTNFADEAIAETLPAFTVDTAGTVTGNKAFKTITKVTIPAHDGTGATTSIGFGTKLGLPYKLAHNTIQDAYRNNVREGTAPTVVTSATAIEANTVTLNSALNGTPVDLYLFV